MNDLSKLTPNEETVAALIEAELAPWISYADKLEAALKLACGQRSDILMRMHAEQGLRVVRPSTFLTEQTNGDRA